MSIATGTTMAAIRKTIPAPKKKNPGHKYVVAWRSVNASLSFTGCIFGAGDLMIHTNEGIICPGVPWTQIATTLNSVRTGWINAPVKMLLVPGLEEARA
jgi:hypothetical protein